MSEPLAARYLGISPTSLRKHGPQPVPFRRRRLYDIKALDRWADALDGQPLTNAQKVQEGDDMAQRIRERMSGKN